MRGAHRLWMSRHPSHSQNDELAHEFFERGHRLEAAVTIQRSPEEIERGLSRTRALHEEGVSLEFGPEQVTIGLEHKGGFHSWRIPIIHREPGERIAWRSDEGVPNAGSIRFRALAWGRGTEVRVVVEYLKESDDTGKALKNMFDGPPEQVLQRALFRLRQELETGEIATTSGQPHGGN